MDEIEIWKAIPGFEGKYEASNLGRIKSLLLNRLSVLTEKASGYFVVDLEGRQFRVNRVVLTTFIGLPSPKQNEAAHLDGNRKNNRLQNLKWSSRLENEQHKRIHGRIPRGSKSGRSKLNEEQVETIIDLHRLGATRSNLAEFFKISEKQIQKIVYRKQWRHLNKGEISNAYLL